MRVDEIDNIVRATVARHCFHANEEDCDNIFKDLCGFLPDTGLTVNCTDENVLVIEVNDKLQWTVTVEGISFDKIKVTD